MWLRLRNVEKKDVCPFLLLENSRPLSPQGPQAPPSWGPGLPGLLIDLPRNGRSHYSLNLPHSLLPMLCPQVHSLCLHLYSCPANRLVLLDSIYMLIHGICFSEGSQEGSFKMHPFPKLPLPQQWLLGQFDVYFSDPYLCIYIHMYAL